LIFFGSNENWPFCGEESGFKSSMANKAVLGERMARQRLGLIRFPELITGAGSGPGKPLRPRW